MPAANTTGGALNNSIEGALIDSGVDGNTTYDPVLYGTGVKTAAILVCQTLLTTADTQQESSGQKITYDRVAIQKRIDNLKKELGIADETVPTVRGVEVW